MQRGPSAPVGLGPVPVASQGLPNQALQRTRPSKPGRAAELGRSGWPRPLRRLGDAASRDKGGDAIGAGAMRLTLERAGEKKETGKKT